MSTAADMGKLFGNLHFSFLIFSDIYSAFAFAKLMVFSFPMHLCFHVLNLFLI